MPSANVAAARRERLERVRSQMDDLGVDALLCSLGADLPWLVGYEAMPLERPTVLVVTSDDKPTLVVPALEAARVAHDPDLFDIAAWRDGEDPIALIAGLVGTRAQLAISDQSWAR